MINLAVYYDENKLVIDDGSKNAITIKFEPWRKAMPPFVEELLNEVLNRIMHSGESVCIERVTEDGRIVIAEW